MPFQVSPGVNISEIDLTTVIPAVSTSVGASVGQFNWGPVDEISLITSETELASVFGKPDANNKVDYFSAANFLDYTNALRVIRVANGAARNACGTTSSGLLIKNDEHFASGLSTPKAFYAKYPGVFGNSLRVELCDHAGSGGTTGGFKNWYVNSHFTSAPGTSVYASKRDGANDELHIAVIDDGGLEFSGTANTVLELYPFVSKAYDAKDENGDTNYFKAIINNRSNYIRVGTETEGTNVDYGKSVVGTTFGNTASGKLSLNLSGGLNGGDVDGLVAPAVYNDGWDLFADADKVDISLIIAGDGGRLDSGDSDRATVLKYINDNVADKRKDVVAFFSPHYSDTVNTSSDAAKLTAVKGFRNTDTNFNSSYSVMDSGWKYQYNKYTGDYFWMPLNPDVAGLCARTDQERDSWWSPAGYNRGQIKNVVRLAYNPTKAHRDDLYRAGINPVVSFPGQGTMLFGDKTQLKRSGAFDRINVRRLFIVLEKAISTAAKFQLFEFNDEFTRAQFRNMVEPFLRDVQGRRGITDYQVICDDTNNPGNVIDRNEFVGDIYVKPTRSINFIQLNFTAVATGVDFSEIVGKF